MKNTSLKREEKPKEPVYQKGISPCLLWRTCPLYNPSSPENNYLCSNREDPDCEMHVLDKLANINLRHFFPFLTLFIVHAIDVLMSLPYLKYETSIIYWLFGMEVLVLVKFGYATFLLVLHQKVKDSYDKKCIRYITWVAVAICVGIILWNINQISLIKNLP